MNTLTHSLDEHDSKALLRGYGIPTARDSVCARREELAQLAGDIPLPWVMKIVSADIPHKTEAGGVVLGVESLAEAEDAFERILRNAKAYKPNAHVRGVMVQEMVESEGVELIVGMNRDEQFGPVVLFGLGGIYVELFQMASMRLVPLSAFDAGQMIDELPLAKLFEGFRGKQFQRQEIIELLLNLSRLVQDHPEIREIDINPLLLRQNGSKAVDALVLV